MSTTPGPLGSIAFGLLSFGASWPAPGATPPYGSSLVVAVCGSSPTVEVCGSTLTAEVTA